MNKNVDVANIVVNEQFNRLLEQERKRCELLPMPEFEQECPFISKDQMCEIALRIAVVMKISVMAGLN